MKSKFFHVTRSYAIIKQFTKLFVSVSTGTNNAKSAQKCQSYIRKHSCSGEYERGSKGVTILNGFSGIVCYIFESFQVTRDVVQRCHLNEQLNTLQSLCVRKLNKRETVLFSGNY